MQLPLQDYQEVKEHLDELMDSSHQRKKLDLYLQVQHVLLLFHQQLLHQQLLHQLLLHQQLLLSLIHI